MIKYDIKNGILYGATISAEETTIAIPDNVERIKSLRITHRVEKLIIPSSVSQIDIDAFSNATNLFEIEIHDNSNFIMEKKCLYDKARKTVYLAERNISGRLAVPSSVRSVSAYAFAHCSWLKSVKLNQNVDYIGAFAFTECMDLSSINIPTLCPIELKEGTFEGCSALCEITIPGNVTSLGKCLFYDCWNLERVHINTDLIKTIPFQCFAYCESLLRVDFKEGVSEIQDNAFLGCEKLTEATFPSSICRIGSSIFLDVPSVTVFSDSQALKAYCEKHGITYHKAVY